MHAFIEALELSAIWILGAVYGWERYKHKIKKQVKRNAQYKVVTNSLYGKRPANVPRHPNGTACLTPATCREHDAVSKYPDVYRDDYIREFERGDDSTQRTSEQEG